MTTPNQLTACATATRQGVYRGYVRMYNEEEGRYGLLYKDFFFGPRTRDRKVAIKAVREIIKQIKDMAVDEQRLWLETNQKARVFKK